MKRVHFMKGMSYTASPCPTEIKVQFKMKHANNLTTTW